MEIVEYLLEHGAVLERDTFVGERCLYGALNDQIRNILLKNGKNFGVDCTNITDASTKVDVNQPFAAHLSSLLKGGTNSCTSDITVSPLSPNLGSDIGVKEFKLHRFILAARSSYFRKYLTSDWKDQKLVTLALFVDPKCFENCLRWMYLDVRDMDIIGDSTRSMLQLVAETLEIPRLMELFLSDSKQRRKNRLEQTSEAQDNLAYFLHAHVIDAAFFIQKPRDAAAEEAQNGAINLIDSFADVLLGVSVAQNSCKIYPCHKAMLVNR